MVTENCAKTSHKDSLVQYPLFNKSLFLLSKKLILENLDPIFISVLGVEGASTEPGGVTSAKLQLQDVLFVMQWLGVFLYGVRDVDMEGISNISKNG